VAARVKEFALGRLISKKKGELQALDPAGDAESYDRLFGEIVELQRERAAIRVRPRAGTEVEAE
jgi:hypothetical protein